MSTSPERSSTTARSSPVSMPPTSTRSSRSSAHARPRRPVFFCGSGGGAGHASHAACDFRKLAHIECYCVNDNMSELTARINDDGWDPSYADWLRASRLSAP